MKYIRLLKLLEVDIAEVFSIVFIVTFVHHTILLVFIQNTAVPKANKVYKKKMILLKMTTLKIQLVDADVWSHT